MIVIGVHANLRAPDWPQATEWWSVMGLMQLQASVFHTARSHKQFPDGQLLYHVRRRVQQMPAMRENIVCWMSMRNLAALACSE